MKIRIYPYKQGSGSAKELANALEGRVLKLNGSKYRPKPGDVVVNWGSATFPAFPKATTLNADVTKAQDKLLSFNAFKDFGVSIPDFWTKKEDIPDDAFPIVCRTKLRSHSGDGIVIADNRVDLVAAPLYVRYIKKQEEYRVHVINGEVCFVQRKAKRLDVEQPNWQVRNLAGGFVFVAMPKDENDIRLEWPEVPKQVTDEARKALHCLGLDLGGVDVIWNERAQKAFVLEINTACGLEERTAKVYAEYIKEYYIHA